MLDQPAEHVCLCYGSPLHWQAEGEHCKDGGQPALGGQPETSSGNRRGAGLASLLLVAVAVALVWI